jgi:hypothetical protein
MNGWDFSILWHAGQAVLAGQSPYSVAFFYYPLPFAYALVTFALLPESVSFWLWVALNVGLLILVFRRRFWTWLFYVPMLHMLSSGNVDFFWWVMERGLGRHWRGAIIGALMTLKPQVAILLLPWHLFDWLRHERSVLARWALLTFLLWAAPLAWDPGWITDWLSATPNLNIQTATNSPGLFSLLKAWPQLLIPVMVCAAAIFLWGIWQENEVVRASAVLASPIGMFYQTMALLGCAPPWLLVPTSLVAAALSIATNTFIPFILIPLAVIAWHVRTQRVHPVPLPT